MSLPDLSAYWFHREIEDADLDGTVVPGLTATFYRRAADPRVATVGVYRCAGADVFMAWGYVGEAHCRHHAYHEGPAGWGAARPGCPDVHEVLMRCAQPRWVPT